MRLFIAFHPDIHRIVGAYSFGFCSCLKSFVRTLTYHYRNIKNHWFSTHHIIWTWHAEVYGVTKLQTWLNDWTEQIVLDVIISWLLNALVIFDIVQLEIMQPGNPIIRHLCVSVLLGWILRSVMTCTGRWIFFFKCLKTWRHMIDDFCAMTFDLCNQLWTGDWLLDHDSVIESESQNTPQRTLKIVEYSLLHWQVQRGMEFPTRTGMISENLVFYPRPLPPPSLPLLPSPSSPPPPPNRFHDWLHVSSGFTTYRCKKNYLLTTCRCWHYC